MNINQFWRTIMVSIKKKFNVLLSYGLKILFFGKPEGCPPESKNGPVIIVKILNGNINIEKQTGLSVSNRGNIFLPVQDKTLCNVQDKILEGGS